MTDEPALAAAVGTGRGVDLDAQPFVLITGMSGAGRTTTANNAVPLPGTLALVMAGLVAWLPTRRR